MKYFVISDNNDTLVGMRLAGIQGVLCHSQQEAVSAITAAVADPEIAILMVTEKLAAGCDDLLAPIKMTNHTPLIVEIPDRDSDGRSSDSITRYIREAIGVKI